MNGAIVDAKFDPEGKNTKQTHNGNTEIIKYHTPIRTSRMSCACRGVQVGGVEKEGGLLFLLEEGEGKRRKPASAIDNGVPNSLAGNTEVTNT
jgi:hypothetical protein